MYFSRRVVSCILFNASPKLSIISSVSRMASTSDDRLLSIPKCVRGMKELEKEKFMTTIPFPVISIDARDCTVIRGKVRLEKYLLGNLHKIKNLMDNPEDQSKKFLVFDPDMVVDDEVRQNIIVQIEKATGKETRFEKKPINIEFENWDIRRIIKAILPDGLDFSSFTQTGHIIHCNFREELMPFKKILGQVLLNKVHQCKTVVNKLDGITSEYRNFELELVAGEPNYVAEVVENGIRYKMDFSKVFWNSRLSHEHDRVLKRIDSRAIVYDACAGVGPFVLPAVKKRKAKRVFANDLNPESIAWMKQNIKINKIMPSELSIFNVDANLFIQGPLADDLAKEISLCVSDPELTPPSGAHILMNLPAYAVTFLPAFRGILKGKTNVQDLPFPITLYCYLFAKAHEEVADVWFEEKARQMVAEKLRWESAEVTCAHHVRTVSSRKEMYCMQISLPLDLLLADPLPQGSLGSKEPPEKRQKTE